MKLIFFITIIILSASQGVQAQQESNQSNCPILRLVDEQYARPDFRCGEIGHNRYQLTNLYVEKIERNDPDGHRGASNNWGNSDSKSLLLFLSVQNTQEHIDQEE